MSTTRSKAWGFPNPGEVQQFASAAGSYGYKSPWTGQTTEIPWTTPTWMALANSMVLTAGGYYLSFAAKRALNEPYGSLVTGDLSVVRIKQRLKPGSNRTGVNSSGWFYFQHDQAMSAFLVGDHLLLQHTDWTSLVEQAQTEASLGLARLLTKTRATLLAAYSKEIGASVDLLFFYLQTGVDLFRNADARFRQKLRKEEKRQRRRTRRERARASRHMGQRIVDLAVPHWLALQFGLKPLIDDTGKLVEAVQSYAHSIELTKLRYASKAESVVAGTYEQRSGYLEDLYHQSRRSARRAEVKLLTFLRMQPQTYLENFAQQMGLDSRSIVPTLYEILPYSWLLDYVSNVGDVLDAWSALPELSSSLVQSTVVTEQKELHSSVTRGHFLYGGDIVYRTVDPMVLNTRQTQISRSLRVGVPSPSFRWVNKFVGPGGKFRLSMVASVAWVKLSRGRVAKAIDRLMSLG